MRVRFAGISLAIGFALLALSGVAAKTDPATGLVRVVCIGESYYPETRLPIILAADPRIRYQPIPANWYESTFAAVGASKKDVFRFMRMYLPRSYDRLLQTYDVVLLSDFEVDVVTDEQWVWMERSVREVGMGMGKYEMNWDPSHFSTFQMFVTSAVYPVFPADLQEGKLIPKPISGIYAVDLPETGRPHPMLNLPGMRRYSVLVSGDYGYEIPRSGSTVVARFVPRDEEAIIIWVYGNGRSLTCLPGHDKIDSSALTQWPFALDFWINQMWYLAGLEIPGDVELVHQLRDKSLVYSSERSLATAVIEFVEKFGVSTGKLYDHLFEVDETKKAADRLYLENRYTESLDKLNEAFEGLKKVADESVKMKEKALFWIYIVEWFAVTGTAVLAGFVLWTLMVRRRLYREVRVTRSGR